MDATLLGQSPPYTYPNPTQYFIFNFLIMSFIFIKNKCFSDVIWNLKREKKVHQKADSNPGRSFQKEYDTCFTICTTESDDWWPSFVMLTCPITRLWVELV